MAQILPVLEDEDIGICFLIETDDQHRKIKQNVVPNYSIHTTKVKNDTDKVRIIALIRSDIKFKIREDIMSTNQQTLWIEIIKNNSKNVLCSMHYSITKSA